MICSAAADHNQLNKGIHDLTALYLLVYQSILNVTPHLRAIQVSQRPPLPRLLLTSIQNLTHSPSLSNTMQHSLQRLHAAHFNDCISL